MTPELSILISSYNRTALFRRCLWSVAYRPPAVPFEVVVADDGSTEDVLGVLREFSACFPWKFVRVDSAAFERATGVARYHNNPAWTNNVAFRHSLGRLVALMGNEVIATEGVFASLLDGNPEGVDWLTFSTTYDLRKEWLERLDAYGQNLTANILKQCEQWPLQSEHYRSDVTNYLSVCPRAVWDKIGGYDERYVGGISSDDSDFVRRARAAGVRTRIADGVTLHQYHAGKTAYYDPPADVITSARWDEGVRRNHAVYHAWDGTPRNPQPWPWGTLGVVDVTENCR